MKADIDKIGYPLDIREYDYTPVDAGIYDIPQLKSISKGPWELITTPDGYYQMKDTVSGKCLALFTGSKHLDVVTQVGATPELRNCADVSVGQDQRDTANERNTQKWQIRADKDGKYTISPALTQQRLAIATGNEQNIDLETHRPAAGTVAQFPADLVSDNALFTLTGHMGMSATVDSKTVNPASPSKITVKVRAASNANTGDVTVTPVVPEGWEIKPGSVSLKSIPAGKAAIAYFNVVNTTGTGDATVQFKLTNTKTGEELGTTSVALTGSLTKDVEASDYAASSPGDHRRACSRGQRLRQERKHVLAQQVLQPQRQSSALAGVQGVARRGQQDCGHHPPVPSGQAERPGQERRSVRGGGQRRQQRCRCHQLG